MKIHKITWVVVERKPGFTIIRSRHRSRTAADRAQAKRERALEKQHPGLRCSFVTYCTMPLWYRHNARVPDIGENVGTYAAASTVYAVAPLIIGEPK